MQTSSEPGTRNVRLQHDRIFIDHGRLYCSAGVTAGMDLSLYLVKKFCGRQAATQEDISFFRKLFIRLTGLRPKEYQKKFAGFAVHLSGR